jgi:hypothetical protein
VAAGEEDGEKEKKKKLEPGYCPGECIVVG